MLFPSVGGKEGTAVAAVATVATAGATGEAAADAEAYVRFHSTYNSRFGSCASNSDTCKSAGAASLPLAVAVAGLASPVGGVGLVLELLLVAQKAVE